MSRRIDFRNHTDTSNPGILDDLLDISFREDSSDASEITELRYFRDLHRERILINDVPMQNIELRVKHMVESLDDFRNRQVMSGGVNHKSTPLEGGNIFNADGQSSNLIVIFLINLEQLRESFEAPQKSRIVVGIQSQALVIFNREAILFVIDFSGDEEASILDIDVKGNIAGRSIPRALENFVEVVLNHGVDFNLLRTGNHILHITGTHLQNLTVGIGLEGDRLGPDPVGSAGGCEGDGSGGQEEEEQSHTITLNDDQDRILKSDQSTPADALQNRSRKTSLLMIGVKISQLLKNNIATLIFVYPLILLSFENMFDDCFLITLIKQDMICGKNVVLTGGNIGIGLETAKGLYADGHHIIFGSRNEERNIIATQTILQSAPNSKGSVKWFKLDLSKRASIEEFAKFVCQEFKTIDILVNNAGMIMNERQVNEMGVEMTMAVNHFGPFYLTYLLFPSIKNSKEARIINLSSQAHRHTSLVTSDDLPGNDFSSLGYYSKSKLANVQFTVGLADRVSKYPNIKVMCLHPGIVDSDFATRTPFCSCLGIFKCLCCCCYIDTETGARTSLFLSRENFANLRSGEFYDSDTTLGNMNPLGRNRQHAERLWKTSEQLFKIEFTP